jgi:hypothetical protein
MEDERGQVVTKPGSLRLTARRRSADAPTPTTGRLFAVRWGNRGYLIEESQWLTFVNYVNSGWGPRESEQGQFFFREGDSGRQAAGRPAVPDAWRAFLLEKPVCGHVLRVLDGNKAELDLGSNVGLRVGLVLHARVRLGERFEVSVVSVGPLSSVIASDPHDDHISVNQEICSTR